MAFRSSWCMVLIALIVFASMAAPAGATPLLFTDQTAWQAASTGLVSVDFEGYAGYNTSGYFNTAAGFSGRGGLQIIGLTPPDSYYLFTQDPSTSTNYSWGTGDVLMGPNIGWGNGYIQANLPAGGVTSVGSNVMTHTPFAAAVTVSLSTGDTFVVDTFNNPTPAFVGFTSEVPITYIRFTPATGYSLIDNFSYGSSSTPVGETPEAETLILGGTGLLGLGLARRLRKFVP